MAEAIVRCPHCQSEAVVRYGNASNGKARLRCQPREGCGRTFLQTYAYPGRLPAVKQQMGEMTLNGSGIRDIARVLPVGLNTVIRELKKSSRPLPSQPQRGGGLLSGRDYRRSATCGSGRGGCNEEEAQTEVKTVLGKIPPSLYGLRQRVPLKDPAVLKRYLAALCKAGLK
jgi:transposase-like protein